MLGFTVSLGLQPQFLAISFANFSLLVNSHHRPFSLETLSNVWIRPGSVEAPPIPHKPAPSSHLCSWAPYYNLGHNRAINVNRALSVSTRPEATD